MKNLLCIAYLLLGTSIGRILLVLLLISMLIPDFTNVLAFIGAILVFFGIIYMVVQGIITFISFINGK